MLRKINIKTFREKQFCQVCINTHDIIRYNPFYDILKGEDDKCFKEQPAEYIESIQELSETLKKCKRY